MEKEENSYHDTRLEVDVAIIGNGPAGIALSHMLSGHLPYFTGAHPNRYLTQKLAERPHDSLLEQNLEDLSDGLEGRSNNPVSILFDALMHPNADIGETHAPTLTWHHDPSKAVSHVVVGSGKPGGSWHRMNPDLETVSLGHWLELPDYPFNQWRIDQEKNHQSNGAVLEAKTRKRALLGEVAQYYEDYVTKMGLEDNFLNDVKVVCATDVRRTKVNKPILESQTSSTSSSLSSSPCLDSPSLAMSPAPADIVRSLQEDLNDQPESEDGDHLLASADDVFPPDSEPLVGDFHVNVDLDSKQVKSTAPDNDSVAPTRGAEVGGNFREDDLTFPSPFQTLVPETPLIECFPESSCCCVSDPDDGGVYCRETRKIKSEYKWCIRGRRNQGEGEIQDLDVKILAKKVVLACGVEKPRKLNVPGENYPFIHHEYNDIGPMNDKLIRHNPILVVGAGLSAADAVLLALRRGIPVLHAFYQGANDPRLIFHKMPPDTYKEYRHVFALMQGKATNENYTPLAKHRVVEFDQGGVCRLRNSSGNVIKLVVSSCYVLIGSEAYLGFLPHRLSSKLGIKSDVPIHPKTNPVDIDPFSFQCDSVPSLYAVGPLVGDNFVRFVLGGALGIARHLTGNRSKDV